MTSDITHMHETVEDLLQLMTFRHAGYDICGHEDCGTFSFKRLYCGSQSSEGLFVVCISTYRLRSVIVYSLHISENMCHSHQVKSSLRLESG